MADYVPITPGAGAPIGARNISGIFYQIIQSLDEALNQETDGSFNYYAFAVPGSSTSSPVWKVFRIAIVLTPAAQIGQKQYADGNANYDNVGTGMAVLIYS